MPTPRTARPSRPSPLALFALFAALFAAPVACQPSPPAPAAAPPPATAPVHERPDADEPLLRTYTVPPDQARSLEAALRDALRTGHELPPLGTVERLPDGRLIVVAPPGVQEGVEAMILGLDHGKAMPVRTAEIQYWIVVAEPAAEAAGIDAIPDIAPALRAVVDAQGPMKFRLFEQMRIASLLDERGEAEGARMSAHQRVTEVGGRLVADLELKMATTELPIGIFCHGSECKQIKSRVHLDPGQLLVIGQSSALFGKAGDKGDDAPKTIFYVVRGQIRSGGE